MEKTAQQITEEREQEEQRRRLAAQGDSKDGGIMEAIMGFLKFLFEIFFPSKDAPNEDPADIGAPPVSAGEKIRLGKLILEKRAIPNWKEYQQEHKGEKVDFINPVKEDAVVTSNFGMRMHPIKKVMLPHSGVDIDVTSANKNPEIMAAASGIVLFAGKKQGYGNTVVIGHADGSYTLYGHMKDGSPMPEIGSEVPQGKLIGIMGNTGGSKGDHLHFEVRKGEDAVQPRIAGVNLKTGVKLAEADLRTIQRAQASAAPAQPTAPAPATPTQLAGINLPKLPFSDVLDGAKKGFDTQVHNARVAIGSVFRG